jgi:hypothetical protein
MNATENNAITIGIGNPGIGSCFGILYTGVFCCSEVQTKKTYISFNEYKIKALIRDLKLTRRKY